MYINKLYDENIGPIEKVRIEFPFSEEGLPKPVVLVGENGSGKSTLISNIVDSFYGIAAQRFDNAMYANELGAGFQFYKAFYPTEIKIGREYLFSYILFRNNPPIHYVFKVGKLAADELQKKLPEINPMPFSWQDEYGFKGVNVNEREAKQIFETDVICYFGPDRYEKPMWMGEKYYDDNIHPSVQGKIARVLANPLSVKNVTEENLQWLMDVIVDARADVEMGKDGGLGFGGFHTNTLWQLATARRNVETILGTILEKDVKFVLNIRHQSISRFQIFERATNQVVVPTLDALSSGQIALFNMFSTIVRYAETTDLRKSITLENITGIVVIDEIELHLHTRLQKEVLPKLIKLFPRVQFVITSHSPLFLLGMQETFCDEGFEVYEMPTATKISVERFSEFQRAYDAVKATETYQKDVESVIEAIKSQLTSKVLVITEGATDWKLMKTAREVLRRKPEYADVFDGLDFSFLEYEPKNSQEQAPLKREMGKDTLVRICKSYATIPQDKTCIFIADCDDKDTNKALGALPGQVFMKWPQNVNVYSFTIPIPESRSSTPNISIEHLFSDSEIKTEVIGKDNVARRLFMGNEFDSRGLSLPLQLHCRKTNACGPDKINIIDGTSEARVTKIDGSDDATNYALPKMDFARYVSENPEKFNFDNFMGIFKTIKAIIEDRAASCQNKQQA